MTPEDRYRLAETISQIGVRKVVRNAAVYPRWIGDGTAFWYDHETKDGIEYRRIDAATGRITALFDHDALAVALNEHLPVLDAVPTDLPIERVTVDADGALTFAVLGQFHRYGDDGLAPVTVAHAPNLRVSPDGRHGAFLREHNLWVRNMATGSERPLTTDGEEHHAYGTKPECMNAPYHLPEARWSPDSRHLLTLQIDERQVLPLPMIDWAPTAPGPDGKPSIRPTASSVRTALPGDEHVTQFQIVAIDVDAGRLVTADHPALVAVRMNDTPFSAGLTWWSADGAIAYFVDIARGEQSASVIAFDVITGTCRTVFTETTETYLDLGLNVYMPAAIVPLQQSSQLLWLSERSGWAHLYRYDLDTGECLNAVTAGDWLVREVLHVDEVRREVLLAVAGREPGIDPYYRQIIRVGLDGGDPVVIADGDCDHMVIQPGDMSLMMLQVEGKDTDAIAGAAPSGNHLVVSTSRADSVPVSRLIDRDGVEVAVIAEADISGLPPEWIWPEPFAAIAADGETDIHGLLFRPVGLEPGAAAPVIDYIYGGPQVAMVPKASFNNVISMNNFLESQVLAALGFAVVMIDGRGTALRSKAFHDHSHGAVHLASDIDDHIAAITQLAARRGDLDLTRVGIHGFSGGGYATAGAMLRRPEFFHVGVAGGGNYDQRLFWSTWGERFHGVGADVDFDTQHHLAHAEQLAGKLLFIHGLQDSGCHPSALLQLVQALMDAQKDFDLLLQPRMAHGMNGYVTRRIWDYFMTHLAGETPPKDIRITNGTDILMETMLAKQAGIAEMIANAAGVGATA